MPDSENCSNCSQSHDCKAVYEKLGKSKGPSVAGKSVLVFLGPLIVFIVCLAILDDKLAVITGSDQFGMVLAAVVSVVAAFVYVLAVKTIIARTGSRGSSCHSKENHDRD